MPYRSGLQPYTNQRVKFAATVKSKNAYDEYVVTDVTIGSEVVTDHVWITDPITLKIGARYNFKGTVRPYMRWSTQEIDLKFVFVEVHDEL